MRVYKAEKIIVSLIVLVTCSMYFLHFKVLPGQVNKRVLNVNKVLREVRMNNTKPSTSSPKSEQVHYLEPWEISPPQFIKSSDESYYETQKDFKLHGKFENNYSTLYDIRIFRNACLKTPHPDCGFKTTREEQDKMYLSSNGSFEYESVSWLILPDSWSYQHFLDGMMPKIAMIADLHPNNVYIIASNTLNSVIRELDFMNLTYELYKPSKRICAKQVIDICRLAGTHPVIWQKMHQVLVQNMPEPQNPSQVVYIPRNINTKNGRHVDNEKEVIEILKQRYKNNLVVFDHTKYDLKEFRKLMLNTTLMLGINGGGLASNILFVSKKAKIIDFMLFTWYGGVEMPYFSSRLRGLDYIRVYVKHNKARSHVTIDLNDLRMALDKMDQKLPANKNSTTL